MTIAGHEFFFIAALVFAVAMLAHAALAAGARRAALGLATVVVFAAAGLMIYVNFDMFFVWIDSFLNAKRNAAGGDLVRITVATASISLLLTAGAISLYFSLHWSRSPRVTNRKEIREIRGHEKCGAEMRGHGTC